MFTKAEGCTKLSPCAFGVALGVADGLGMLLFAWAAHFWGFGTPFVDFVASVWHGYAVSIMGGVYGFFWGFVQGFVFGVIVAGVYNYCLLRCCRKSSSE